ncbi:uncharacterized protein LOC128248839 [Octopus bimaculoides]|uniref:uncharacterized protein LOC128248839 n=1 Tax=Octopus bimaculoides TaxID=37653 RepID=UPI0022E93888|nr:uncharacterized protein LOC128248839 [Octopus bimaculoides]
MPFLSPTVIPHEESTSSHVARIRETLLGLKITLPYIANNEHFMLKKVSIPVGDILGQRKNKTLNECNEECNRHHGCKSYQYNEESKLCVLSNVTQWTVELTLNKKSVDVYIANPVYSKIDCGTPKDVVGAFKLYNTTTYESEVIYTCSNGEQLKSECEKDNKWSSVASVCNDYTQINCGTPKAIANAMKSYKTTTYKSEVTYTCPKGEKFKSTCEKDNKWTPVASACKDIQIHFVKVKDAALDVTEKTLWSKEKVTADACAEKCFSDKSCVSFEIIKASGLCYLLKKTAASSKIKTDQSRDYYQRVKSDEPLKLKQVNIPKAVILEQLKDKTLNECNEACQEYEGCNSYEYNEKDKLCGLSNVTQLTGELKPNIGNWDVYIINPVFTRVDCGPPKDIAGASKSYETTTYNSEVIYTCPEGEKLKSICADDDNWTPVASSCKVAELHFVKVTDAILDVSGKILVKENVTIDACAKKCLDDSKCLAFEITKGSGNCYLSQQTAASTKKIKSDKSRDYYQRIKSKEEIFTFKRTLIRGEDSFERLTNVSLMECSQACHLNPICNSYEYNEKLNYCDRSNVTHLTHALQPSGGYWDVYVRNPDFVLIDCGTPKEVVGSLKSYNSTMYKSEVTYTCPTGEKLKSVCEKDNKWTSVASSCKDSQLHFVKIKDSALDVTEKTLSKNAVTADACAERCFSDETCLSFEITKGSGKCYLSKQTAASSKKIKIDKSRDYYQRVKSDKPLQIKRVSLSEKESFGRLANVNLKKCSEACFQYPSCNSYEYNEKAKLCDLSKVTQLTDQFKPNNGNWDAYMITPVYIKIDCGPPKDIADTSKSYNTTTYNSKVTYTCPGEEKFESICKEDENWTPVVIDCKETQIHFMKIKDAILDVTGKTLWDNKNVTAKACAEKCFSDENCLSFEINEKSRQCYLSKESAASKELKPIKGRIYYQRVKFNDQHITFKKASLPMKATFEQLKDVSLIKCNESCHRKERCTSYAYNVKDKLCNLSNVTQLTTEIKPNNGGWDVYIINPVYTQIDCETPKDIVGTSKSYKTTTYKSEVNYTCPGGEQLKSICEKDNKWTPVKSMCKVHANIDCGSPKDIVGAAKSYKTTTYKSKVTYTCPKGEQLKSICEKDNKWTPIASTCKDAKIHFVRVENATLNVVGKILWNKKNATADTCAEKCFSDKSCLSFELNKSSGECYLSKQTAATTEKLASAKSIDYYQRVDSDKPFKLHKVSISKKTALKQFEDKTATECNKKCYEYQECNSYEYNEKSKLCVLTNVTQLTGDLKPNLGSWDVYIISPVFTKVDCGPPTYVVDAKKSYTTTTYKSEVTYTCPEGETFKSVCKEDNKWSPVVSSCEVIVIKFVKIEHAILNVLRKTLLQEENVTASACAKKCLSDITCSSFEVTKESRQCYLSKDTASSNKITISKDRDYYQRIRPNDAVFSFKRSFIKGHDAFERLNNVSLKECEQACHQTPECHSYEYQEAYNFCDRSNVTHLTHQLQPSVWGWDLYIINPVYSKIDCGPPKDVVAGVVKSYKTTTYKSEANYVCPNGVLIKSICEKNKKWTSVVPSCKVSQIYFVKVKGAVLDVSGKILWNKQNVSVETCAKKCFSDKNCLSFEIIKASGKCYLSKQTAASSEKIKADKSRDYYQRVKSNDEPFVLQKVTLPEQTYIGRLKNLNLKKCKKACYVYPECNAFQYNKNTKFCDLSNVTQLTEGLRPNSGNWDVYILSSVFSIIDCGPPRDIYGTRKSYNTTTYKSEASYSCPRGEKLRSYCNEDSKWTPLKSACEATEIHFIKIKYAFLDITGKTFLKNKKVTAEACAEKCLSDKTCLSFEINKENKNCYLSKESAATSNKLNPTKNSDYYQRIIRN